MAVVTVVTGQRGDLDGQFAWARRSAWGPGPPCGDAAVGAAGVAEEAEGAAGGDGAVGDGLPGVGDGQGPAGVRMGGGAAGDLSGQGGVDGPEPADVGGAARQSEQGGQG